MNTIDLLCKFVNQRSGIDFNNYGDVQAFNAERRSITKDRNTFYELLSLAQRRIDNLNDKLTARLKKSAGRLTMNDNGALEYCTGQYFPTEYRKAASRIMATLIWADYLDEKDHKTGEPVYTDGHAIRKAINRQLRSRDAKEYFQ